MADYVAPLADMRFALYELVGLERIAALPGYDMATPDLVDAVLEEAGKLAGSVLSPLNWPGDRQGCRYENGVVRTPDGFADAYRQYVEGGWNGLPFEPDHGGQGLPWAVAFAVQEMWQASNMAFSLCPMLNQAAIEALVQHGTPELQATYLEKLMSGEWSGTMDLTEPQAGSDLSAVRAKAIPDGDRFRIHGTKIFITFGEHDMAENIIHMVLARLPDAPEGVKGISLFLVPKVLPNPDGSLGQRNDVRCTGIEHKLGIMGSPTAVLSYGDNDGAVGFLMGEANRGLEHMFTMMNNARLGVGIQGIGIAERAYQQAVMFARERIQSRDVGDPKGDRVAIIKHPDIRRMLMTMKALTEACRALAFQAGAALDVQRRHPDEAARAAAQARVDLLTPVVKGWSTDVGCEVATLGIQVHGGTGYVEETGAAQHYRDARIAPIYEGTNGIQANDLVFRKVARDKGAAAMLALAEMRMALKALADKPGDDAAAIAAALAAGCDALEAATRWIAGQPRTEARALAAGAYPYMQLFGIVAGGAEMAKAAAIALDQLSSGSEKANFYEAKLITARFYAEHILPQAPGLVSPITKGHQSVMAMAEEMF